MLDERVVVFAAPWHVPGARGGLVIAFGPHGCERDETPRPDALLALFFALISAFLTRMSWTRKVPGGRLGTILLAG